MIAFPVIYDRFLAGHGKLHSLWKRKEKKQTSMYWDGGLVVQTAQQQCVRSACNDLTLQMPLTDGHCHGPLILRWK